MSFSLIPYILLPSYADLTPQMLTERGIRLLLCDLDYTLAPKYVPRPDEALRTWLADMECAGVRVMILSNNRSSARVERFCRDLGIDYVGHAGKPSVRGYRQAMEKAGVTPAQTAMLGDKLLTDVLAAKRAGVLSLMVEPLGGAVGPWQKVLHALQAPVKGLCRENTLRSGKKNR